MTILQAEIAYRRHDYAAARKLADRVTPIFTRKDAEPYQKHALDALNQEINRSTK